MKRFAMHVTILVFFTILGIQCSNAQLGFCRCRQIEEKTKRPCYAFSESDKTQCQKITCEPLFICDTNGDKTCQFKTFYQRVTRKGGHTCQKKNGTFVRLELAPFKSLESERDSIFHVPQNSAAPSNDHLYDPKRLRQFGWHQIRSTQLKPGHRADVVIKAGPQKGISKCVTTRPSTNSRWTGYFSQSGIVSLVLVSNGLDSQWPSMNHVVVQAGSHLCTRLTPIAQDIEEIAFDCEGHDCSYVQLRPANTSTHLTFCGIRVFGAPKIVQQENQT